jgi:hypothetical protein
MEGIDYAIWVKTSPKKVGIGSFGPSDWNPSFNHYKLFESNRIKKLFCRDLSDSHFLTSGFDMCLKDDEWVGKAPSTIGYYRPIEAECSFGIELNRIV